MNSIGLKKLHQKYYNMSFLSSRFLKLKNEYIVPLVNLDISNSDFELFELKNLLLDAKFNSVVNLSSDTFQFVFEKSIFLKSILVEFEMFYSKTFIQNKNIHLLNNKKISIDWKIVTDYYRYFYYAVALTRLLMKGNGFLDFSASKQLSQTVSSILGNIFNINRGNFQYKAFYSHQDTNQIILEVKFNTRTSHESVWILVKEVLDTMANLTGIKDSEELIIKTLIQINRDYSDSFMSNIRNDVNYKAKYSRLSLESKISYYFFDEITQEEYLKKISKYMKSEDESTKFYYFTLYGKYIQYLVDALYDDYFGRLNFEKRNKKTYNYLRSKYMKS